jgi:hypothetical protein
MGLFTHPPYPQNDPKGSLLSFSSTDKKFYPNFRLINANSEKTRETRSLLCHISNHLEQAKFVFDGCWERL